MEFFLKISEVRWTENNNRIGNSSYQYYIRTVLTRPQKQTYEMLFTIEVATKSPFVVKNFVPKLECRAECVGLHLCLEAGVCEIFGHSGADIEDIKYCNWLSMVLAAIKGLEMFSPAAGEWKQAHSQARFVIMQVMLEAGQDFVTIKEVTGEDGKPDLLIVMDRSKIMTGGQPAISQFLLKLQVYKSMGDIKTAKLMYDKYCEVNEPWASRREIVVNRRQPRSILVQSNTAIKDEKMELLEYDPSTDGLVR